jgi:integrase
VPSSRPEQAIRRKDISPRQLERTYAMLPFVWRDPLDVQLGTGWHVRELHRFARLGRLELVDDAERPDVAGELIVLRKSGVEKRTPVSAYVLAAALRLRAREGFSLSRYANGIRTAAKAAGVEGWGPGQVRHTVATYARRRAGTRATSDFLDHSETTSKKFYSVYAAPPKVPTPR